ncbi:MAG: AAA family ATPase [Dehalococcoidia bacterium]
MAVVTLTGHLGSVGAIPAMLAERLGYKLVGRELVVAAGAALGWTPEEAGDFDERTGGLGRRLADFFDRVAITQPEVGGMMSAFTMSYADAAGIGKTAGERYFDELRQLVLAVADEGDVVIVGRGGQAILADREDATHIRIACPVEERVRRVAQRDRAGLDAARAVVEHSDREREAWHARYLDIDYRSPYHYGLVLNSGALPDELVVRLIAEVVEAREREPVA